MSFYPCMFTISFQSHLFQWLKSLEHHCQVHALPIKIQSNRVAAIKGCDSRRESGCRTMWSGEVNAVRVISQSIKELMLTLWPPSQQHRIHYHHNGRAAALADMTMGLGNPKLVLSNGEKADTFFPLSSLLFLSFLFHWFCSWTVKTAKLSFASLYSQRYRKGHKNRKVREKQERRLVAYENQMVVRAISDWVCECEYYELSITWIDGSRHRWSYWIQMVSDMNFLLGSFV